MFKNPDPEKFADLTVQHKNLLESVGGDRILFLGCLTPEGKMNSFGSQQIENFKQRKNGKTVLATQY